MPRPATGRTAAIGCEPAPAKVNLALHVTGRRADGYHSIDTLAVFTDLADRLDAAPAARLSLALDGPFATGLGAGEDNLVLVAARALRAAARRRGARVAGARLVLRKELPVAAGIGGGSADAAATLRLLARLWRLGLDETALASIGTRIGADVPMCVHARAARARGIGDLVEPLPALPALPLVLANPGIPLATAAVFARLATAVNPGLGRIPVRFGGIADVAGWLAAQRNDLEAPAGALVPAIGEVRAALAARPGCLLARMSGSGATLFGLFSDRAEAARAAAALAAERPHWWVRAAVAR